MTGQRSKLQTKRNTSQEITGTQLKAASRTVKC